MGHPRGPRTTESRVSPHSRRVTIRDVAEAAGLSPAAVSYALRGIQVSPETQERVRRIADELGYEANSIARALASGRTHMIGILAPSLEDLWQQRLVAQAARALLGRERYPLILDPGGSAERQRLLAAQLRERQVDGMLVSPIDPADPFWSELAETIALVSIGDGLPGAATAGEVLFDNRSGVRAALEHLHALGHRRIGVLCPPGAPTADRPAELAVAAEARRLELEIEIVASPYELEGACAAACGLLGSSTPPSACFCFSDSLAHGVYAAAQRLGLRIPEHLSVIGYDDHPVSALLGTPLTTFGWDTDRVVKEAIEMALAAIEGRRAHRRIVIRPQLRERASTAPAPAA